MCDDVGQQAALYCVSVESDMLACDVVLIA